MLTPIDECHVSSGFVDGQVTQLRERVAAFLQKLGEELVIFDLAIVHVETNDLAILVVDRDQYVSELLEPEQPPELRCLLVLLSEPARFQ